LTEANTRFLFGPHGPDGLCSIDDIEIVLAGL